jgi:flavin reductase (DIM6/NTAB) family NADH-FMN oxidoreductase RutF
VSVPSEDLPSASGRGTDPGQPTFIESHSLHTAQQANLQTPVVAAAPAPVDCELFQSMEIADHMLFVGSARTAILTRGKEPLLYYQTNYRPPGLCSEDEVCGW